MATVYQLPHRPAIQPDLCGIDYIGRRLAALDIGIATLVGRIRQLIDQHGFPPPLGYRKWRGELLTGAIAVTARSYWRRDAVDAFFDGQADGTTPAIAATVQAAHLAGHAAALDANALRLVK